MSRQPSNIQHTYFAYPQIGARLLEYCSMDVVFVAFDIENTEAICPTSRPLTESEVRGMRNFQVGISILDTRDLKSKSAAETPISTRELCVGPEWYCRRISRNFLFGTIDITTFQDASKTLTRLLRFVDPISNTLRPIVGIGHRLVPNSDYGDIACLRKLADLSIISPIIDYLDVNEDYEIIRPLVISRQGTFAPPSLQNMCEDLGIPFATPHIAANDAMFTLRVALMVAVRKHQNQKLTEIEREILSKLQSIALMPLPIVQSERLCFRHF